MARWAAASLELDAASAFSVMVWLDAGRVWGRSRTQGEMELEEVTLKKP
jgi:hypothetical protein